VNKLICSTQVLCYAECDLHCHSDHLTQNHIFTCSQFSLHVATLQQTPHYYVVSFRRLHHLKCLTMFLHELIIVIPTKPKLTSYIYRAVSLLSFRICSGIVWNFSWSIYIGLSEPNPFVGFISSISSIFN
jgi:hypothetical protein